MLNPLTKNSADDPAALITMVNRYQVAATMALTVAVSVGAPPFTAQMRQKSPEVASSYSK
jgi:hypothetical protein